MAKTPNYTDEMVETAKSMYAELGNAGVDEIASVLHKSKRSVIAKLVREGVYAADVKEKAAPRDLGPTKGELLQVLVDSGFDVEGLESATKAAIERVIAVVVTESAETEAA